MEATAKRGPGRPKKGAIEAGIQRRAAEQAKAEAVEAYETEIKELKDYIMHLRVTILSIQAIMRGCDMKDGKNGSL